jgi:hypothetical protein
MESALSQQLWRVLQLLSQRGAVSGLSSRTGAIASPGSLKGTRWIEHYLPREVAGGIAKDVDEKFEVRILQIRAFLSECALGCACGPCPPAAASTAERFLRPQPPDSNITITMRSKRQMRSYALLLPCAVRAISERQST